MTEEVYRATDKLKMTEEVYRATEKGKMSVRLDKAADIKARLNNPTTRLSALADVAEWVKETCLFFGASPVTAYEVATVFIKGLEANYKENT